MWDGLLGALALPWFLLPGKQRRDLVTADRKLARLAGWPRVMPKDMPSLVREVLEQSARVFDAPKTVIAWEETDEPWLRLATMVDGSLRVMEESPAKYDPLVDERLWGLSFFCSDLTHATPVVAWNAPSGLQRQQVQPLHDGLRRDYPMQSVLCLKLDGETVQGHLLLIDVAKPTRDDLIVGDVMAGLIASRMDQLAFRVGQREAVNEERVRVARDLHDGLLQSFTGVVLQLETVHEILQRDPEEARRMITHLQGVMMSEQRELRAYVDELRPTARRPTPAFDFHGRLTELRERFRNEWRVNLDYEIGSMSALVAESLGQETFRLIYEAATNSVKHGQATNIEVKVFTAEDRLRISVMDDGVGFPFRGRYDLAQLNELNQAPASLASRVASLNGEMTINSTDMGSQLEISVPLGLRGA